MPVILKVGIDPVHFGVVMTLNLMIGLLHPPLVWSCSFCPGSPNCRSSGPQWPSCRGSFR
jgi:TRAP-type mannitol/chloroaromatic compound transport system permease large subunit